MAHQPSLFYRGSRAWGYAAVSKRWSFPPKLVETPQGVADATPRPGCTYVWGVNWPPKGRGRGESLSSPRRIDAKLRAQRALEMRRRGATWAQIARALGFADKSGAYRAVKRAVSQADYAVWLKKLECEGR